MSDAIIEFFSSLPGELYVFVISLFPIVELRLAIPTGAAIGLPFYINYPLAILGNMLPVPFILLFISKFLDFLERFKLTRPMVNWLRKKADKHSSKVLVENATDNAAENAAAQALAENAVENAAENAAAQALAENAVENAAENAAAQALAENAALPDTALSYTENDENTTLEQNETAKGNVRKMTPAIFTALMLFVAIPLPGTGAWTGSLIASLFNLPKRYSLLSVFVGVLTSGVIMCLASYGMVGFLSFIL